ncbi:hypothetical protein I4U23_029014 [Adineta vaga]|nr:hypothetical protein I4U23_029014 [Adineta vaga]
MLVFNRLKQELLKSHRHSMSGVADSEHDARKRSLKSIKSLWHDAFRSLKAPLTSSSGSSSSGETRLSFVRRFSLRKKKSNNNNTEQDETIIDPVYETLKIAAETRKMTLANYLQQRQQILNKQTSLNSQGSSEPDIQSSPRTSRHENRTESDLSSSLRPSSYQSGRLSIGKRCKSVRLPSRHMSFPKSPKDVTFKPGTSV